MAMIKLIQKIFKQIKNGLRLRRVKRRASKATDYILSAQVILAEIQGQYSLESEINFWADRVEDCMCLTNKISEKISELFA